MLNDLFAIERGFAAHGIDLVGRHPDIKEMARGWALGVRLTASGAIGEIEFIPEAGRGRVWTLRDGQHNGFPGLKTARGLLALAANALRVHEEGWNEAKDAGARRAELLRLVAEAPVAVEQEGWPGKGHRRRIAERLESLRTLSGDPLAASVPAAFERFLLALDGDPPFLDQVAHALAERVRSGPGEWLDVARTAFVGAVPLVIDVVEEDFDRDAADPKQIAAVSAALSRAAEEGTPSGSGGSYRCAFTGPSARLHRGNFPQPNLPALGQSYLYARNDEIPSLTRYGHTASASFAIDAELVQRLAGVCDALTTVEAKGRTWRIIPAEAGDRPDLLIVSMPAAPGAPLAAALADRGEDDEPADQVTGKARLHELGLRLIEHSRGIDTHGHAVDQVLVLVLRTVDPANRKAIYHRRTTAAAFFEATQRWLAATSNLPGWIAFPVPVKGQAQLASRGPASVRPLSLTPLTRMLFTHGGRKRVDAIGASAADAFALFLNDGDIAARALRLLRLFVQRHGPLFAGLAAARAKGSDHLKKFDPKADLRRDALASLAWVGILLFHIGRRKESYMSDTAFRLGQLLSAADTIHVGYCADQRRGDVPPSLIGNSLLTMAGARPVQVLAILNDRMKPYLAWSKREGRLWEKIKRIRVDNPQTKEQKEGHRLSWDIQNGMMAASRLKEMVDDLRVRNFESAKSDAFKAEIFLGYVAGPEPLPRKSRSKDAPDTGEEMGE